MAGAFHRPRDIMDPATAATWIPILKDIGLPWAAFLAVCWGCWKTGHWLSWAAQRIAEWAGPLVTQMVASFTSFTMNINLRLAAIEDKVEVVGRGVRDVHRRLDVNGFCPAAEDSDDGQPASKSQIIRRAGGGQ